MAVDVPMSRTLPYLNDYANVLVDDEGRRIRLLGRKLCEQLREI